MKEFERINIGLKPTFIDDLEVQHIKDVVFEWLIYSDHPDATGITVNNKKKVLLFQMFLIQQMVLFLSGETGIDQNIPISTLKVKLTKKQQTEISNVLKKVYTDRVNNYLDNELSILKPEKPILR